MKPPSLSLGIEEEYQTIDPETRDLRSHIQMEILSKAKLKIAEKVKAEMHQAVVEVGTKVCRDIKEAREDMRNLRREMISVASENGLLLGSASTHPFADWKVQEIYPDERYHRVVEDMQLVARANLVFGLHVHVGIEDRDTAIHIMNSMRYFLPHILALSSNSPFWMGMETGFKSYRSKVFERFPRTGIPDVFANWADYETFVNLLVKTNCIDNGKKIWWDIRPHPFFETIEVRVCDIPMRLDETLAIAALIQATAAMLYKLHASNKSYRIYGRALISENKFRACRYGLDGKLIDFGKEEEVPIRKLMLEYLHLIDDVVDELGSRDEINYIHEMLNMGSGADRQLKVFRETGDLKKVVDYIVEETRVGVFDNEPARKIMTLPDILAILERDFLTPPLLTDLTTTPFDPELSPGAYNAVNTCLRIQPEEKVTVITDVANREIAASIAKELAKVGSPFKAFVLEELADRPLTGLPQEIADDMETSHVSIFAVRVQQNELKSRMEMTDIVNRRRMRHAHMVNINHEIMLEGMRADFNSVDALSKKVIEIVTKAKQVRAKNPAGSDLVADLESQLQVDQDQRHHQP